MHWEIGSAAGFTSGMPWEPLQPDSLTANVETLDLESGSLLNLYRDLIHLRSRHPAMGAGELIALTTNTPAVTAFVRRDGNRVALVLANLGTEALANVLLRADSGTIPAGEYAPESLFGGGMAAPLEVEADGSFRGYVPLEVVAPLRVYVFDLTR
jgi:glycosidase